MLVIRVAERSDLPSILRLYIQPGMDDRALSIEEAEKIFSRMLTYPYYHLFVACDGEDVVGSFALLIMDNMAHQGAPSAIVEDVVVDQKRHGQGIGKQMMIHARNIARDAHCYKVTLSSNIKRKGAHAFYESLGFALHGYSFYTDV